MIKSQSSTYTKKILLIYVLIYDSYKDYDIIYLKWHVIFVVGPHFMSDNTCRCTKHGNEFGGSFLWIILVYHSCGSMDVWLRSLALPCDQCPCIHNIAITANQLTHYSV